MPSTVQASPWKVKTLEYNQGCSSYLGITESRVRAPIRQDENKKVNIIKEVEPK